MGLPINFIFSEPHVDKAFQWGGSIVEPSNVDPGFATIPLGLADERDDVAKMADSFDFTENADGLQMEGVEIGIIAGSSALVVEDTGQALHSDQTLVRDTVYLEPDADYGLAVNLTSSPIEDIIA